MKTLLTTQIATLAVIMLLSSAFGFAQNSPTTFDFWVGSWDAYWNDSLKGTNTITKAMNNKVVEENFVQNDKGYFGKSWSVFDSAAGVWRQTWVDDTGAYLSFTGGKEGDKVILSKTDSRKGKNGKEVFMRMVFSNIKQQSFDWDWQSSEDSKNTWKTMWAIRYKRK